MKLYEARMRELINFTKQNSIDNPYAASIYNEDGTKIISVISNEDSPVNSAEILAISGCAQLYPAIQWDKISLYVQENLAACVLQHVAGLILKKSFTQPMSTL